MSESFTLTWPEKDVEAIMAEMERGRRELGRDYPHMLRAGMKAILNSVGASTRVAPKKREITKGTAKPPRRGLKAFDVTGYFGKKPKTLQTKTVFSRDKRTATKYHGTIGNSGLAKRTWAIAGKMFGASVLSSAVSSMTDRIAGNSVDVSKNFTGEDQFIQVANGLNYIESALNGGPNDINTAMERAASGLTQSIDRQIVKRMGAQ